MSSSSTNGPQQPNKFFEFRSAFRYNDLIKSAARLPAHQIDLSRMGINVVVFFNAKCIVGYLLRCRRGPRLTATSKCRTFEKQVLSSVGLENFFLHFVGGVQKNLRTLRFSREFISFVTFRDDYASFHCHA